jgi:hypothetical protein
MLGVEESAGKRGGLFAAFYPIQYAPYLKIKEIPPGELFILDSPAGFRKRESGQMEVVLTFERRSTISTLRGGSL